MLGRGLARHREDLRGQQRQEDAVLVGRPHRSVAAQERGPGGLLAAEPERTVDQTVHEPLEADRHFDQLTAETGGDPVDHARRDQRLADPRGSRPLLAVGVQVVDGDGEVVVRVHQPGVRRHDAVPVGVGVVPGRDLIALPLPDQRGHRVRRRAVHPDLSVPVQRHEPPGGVGQRIDHRQIEPVLLGDPAPVRDRRAAQRVGADAHSGRADRVQVEHGRQVGHVVAEEVVRPGGRRRPCAGVRQPAHVLHPARDDLVGPLLDPAGGIGPGGTAVRRVVLEPAVAGRVVGRSDHHTVGEVPLPAPVVAEDGVRDRRGRGVAVGRIDEHGHVIGGEHLDGGVPGRLRQRMGVGAEEERPVRAPARPVLADGLAGGGDVVLVERGGRRRPAVTGGTERHPLVRLGRVRVQRVVRRHQPGHIDEILRPGRLSSSFVRHLPLLRVGRCGLPRHIFAGGPRRFATAPPGRAESRWRTRRAPA